MSGPSPGTPGYVLHRYTAMLANAGIIDERQRQRLDAELRAEETGEQDRLIRAGEDWEARRAEMPWYRRLFFPRWG